MLSPELVYEIVYRFLDDKEKKSLVMDYRLFAHSKEKVGFLGDHRNLVVEVKKNVIEPPIKYRFFVKLLPKLAEHQLKYVRDSKLFDQEAAFFTKLLPILTKKFKNDRKFCPRCYYADEKIIVLEDLRDYGYKMLPDRFIKGKYLTSAVRAQARLHAASLLIENRLNRKINEFCPEVCVDHVFGDAAIDYNRVKIGIDALVRLSKKKFPKRNWRGIPTAMRRGFMRIYRAEAKGRLGRVLCHGDTWPNNYLFDDSSSIPDEEPNCVLVDFQMCRYAPRTFDVAQLLYLGGDREIRRKYERRAIEAYHDELCRCLATNDSKITRPTLEDVRQEYEDVRLSAFYAYAMYHPVLGMCEEVLKIYENNTSEFFENVIFRQNNDYLIQLYDRYPNYAKGLIELIDELIDYCEIHDIPKDYDW